MFEGKVLALAGGVGGGKLVLGLSRVLPPDRLVIAVNTGDDDTFHGLHVSPDLDTIMYSLAGLSNPDTGWGLGRCRLHRIRTLEFREHRSAYVHEGSGGKREVGAYRNGRYQNPCHSQDHAEQLDTQYSGFLGKRGQPNVPAASNGRGQ